MLPAIIPLLLSLAGDAMKQQKEEENQTKAEEFQRKKARQEEEQSRRDYMAQRVTNLGRILGKNLGNQSGAPVSGPEVPHMGESNLGNILGSIGSGLGQLGTMQGSAPGSTPKNAISSKGGPTNPRLWYKPTGNLQPLQESPYDYMA
jgi:hypothetical protein